MSTRLPRTAAVVMAALALTGCSVAAANTGQPAMMRGQSTYSPGPMMGGQQNYRPGPMMGGSGWMMNGSGGWMMGGAASAVTTCSLPQSLPGTTVGVMVGDMGMGRMMTGNASVAGWMMLRSTRRAAPAGQVSFVVRNMGSRTHELVILPLPDGQAPGTRVPGSDGQVDETGSLGEASNACGAGAGEGITPGTIGWVTVNLPAGHYELLCNLPNHYANGMWQEFDVT